LPWTFVSSNSPPRRPPFRKENRFWEEMSDFEEFQQRVQSADTLEQIFAAFKEFNLT
jgi:hypothetical protein